MPRLFAATIITEVEFVSHDPSNHTADANYLRHLIEEIEKAANQLSLRNVREHRVTFCGGGVMKSGHSSVER